VWTPKTSGTSYDLNGTSNGELTFVAVGYHGTTLYSTNLDTWNPGSSPTAYRLRGVSYGNGTFVGVGTYGTTLYSPDGVTWNLGNVLNENNQDLYGVVFRRATCFDFTAVGNYGTIANTTTGAEWTIITEGTTNSLNGIAYGNGTFARWGLGHRCHVNQRGGLDVEDSGKSIYQLYGVAYGNGTFAAVGSGGHIHTSPTGESWTQQNSQTPNHLYGVTTESTLWVRRLSCICCRRSRGNDRFFSQWNRLDAKKLRRLQ